MSKHFSTHISDDLPDLPGVTTHVGTHQGEGRRFGLVAARFNVRLTGAMVTAAVETFQANGVRPADLEVVWVPGSYEIPLFIKRLAASGRFDALLACGVVIEGATRHADLIMNSLVQSFVGLSLEFDCPVVDAVVSARTIEQAEARCLTGPDSRGAYAALAALETASHPRSFPT